MIFHTSHLPPMSNNYPITLPSSPQNPNFYLGESNYSIYDPNFGMYTNSTNPLLPDGFEGLSSSFMFSSSSCPPQTIEYSNQIVADGTISSTANLPRSMDGSDRIKRDARGRITFRTRSGIEVMDDGFKWRKYGKKAVKDNPNPRNYYKCSSRGCNVKKRIEREREDSSYVITTYEGVHNHESPSLLCYQENMNTSAWTL